MVAFWSAAAAMTLLAIGVLVWPVWREHGGDGKRAFAGLWPLLAIVPVSVGLYLKVSTHESYDVAGWREIGDDYRQQGDFGRARVAYEEAWNLAESADSGLKLSLAEMMLYTDPATAEGLAGDLVEEVLQSAPTNQAALWLGGVVAVERGQRGLAAERLTAFLETGPPAEIAAIVREQLLALVGGPVASQPAALPGDGPVIGLEVSVADDISLDRFGPNARLYLVARPPGGRQPIVADQRRLSELPGRFELSDALAMLGGSLADYEAVTVVARISATGNAIAQPGDVFAEATIATDSDETVRLVLDQVVPEG